MLVCIVCKCARRRFVLAMCAVWILWGLGAGRAAFAKLSVFVRRVCEVQCIVRRFCGRGGVL